MLPLSKATQDKQAYTLLSKAAASSVTSKKVPGAPSALQSAETKRSGHTEPHDRPVQRRQAVVESHNQGQRGKSTEEEVIRQRLLQEQLERSIRDRAQAATELSGGSEDDEAAEVTSSQPLRPGQKTEQSRASAKVSRISTANVESGGEMLRRSSRNSKTRRGLFSGKFAKDERRSGRRVQSSPEALLEVKIGHQDFFCNSEYPVITPHTSPWLLYWDLLTFLMILGVAFILPIEMAFQAEDLAITCSMAMCFTDVLYIFDIGLQFFLAFPDPTHAPRVVALPRAIIWHYLAFGFWADMLTIIPADAFLYMRLSRPRLWTRLRLLNMLASSVRLIRIWRLPHMLNRWHTHFGQSYTAITVIQSTAVTVISTHWMACFWCYLSNVNVEHNWLTDLRAKKGGQIDLFDSPLDIYSICMYGAIVTLTTTGYGDIVPQTQIEVRAATACGIVMATLWAYVIGIVCGIPITLCPHDIEYERKLDDLNWLMDDRNMPSAMRRAQRRYFQESKDMNRARVERSSFELMSPLLQGEFALYLHKCWLEKVWYLRDMNSEIVVWVARHLTIMVFSPGEEVIAERTLFIVRRGVATLEGRILVRGDVWGEDLLLSNRHLRSEGKARCLNYLEVLLMHVVDLIDIVTAFPEARARLRWAQVQIAIIRGVKLIAKSVKELRRNYSLDDSKLTEQQMQVLFKQILTGSLDAENFSIDNLISEVRAGNVEIPAQRQQQQQEEQLQREGDEEERVEPVQAKFTGNKRGTQACKRATRCGSDEQLLWSYLEEINCKVDRLLPRDMRIHGRA